MNLGAVIAAAALFRNIIMKGVLPAKFTLPTVGQTGVLTFDEFLRDVCPACSYTDYEDWKKGL